MEKLYLYNVYTFCKSLCVINVGSPYGLHADPIYIWYLYDQMWLVGWYWCEYKLVLDSYTSIRNTNFLMNNYKENNQQYVLREIEDCILTHFDHYTTRRAQWSIVIILFITFHPLQMNTRFGKAACWNPCRHLK